MALINFLFSANVKHINDSNVIFHCTVGCLRDCAICKAGEDLSLQLLLCGVESPQVGLEVRQVVGQLVIVDGG